MPEVSLVLIMDADKEGFLRSERSLIQTIGRAARHLNGRAILYADKVTGSMQRAIDETDRRRQKQMEFNAANGIVPVGVKKSVADIMEAGQAPGRKKRQKVAEPYADYHVEAPTDIWAHIKLLEQRMFQHAKDLEFEQAGQLRDQIQKLKHKAV